MERPDGVYWVHRLAQAVGVTAPGLTDLVRRLRAEGWVADAEPPADAPNMGRPRQYFRLTDLGKREAAAVLDRADGRVPTKHCGRCKTEKPVSAFVKNKLTPDGLSNTCRSCVRAYHVFKRERPTPELPADYTKRCTRCSENLPASAFNKAAVNSDGLHSWCRKCVAAHQATIKPRMKETALLWTYNLTPKAYDDLLQACGGVCCICRQGTPGAGPMRGLSVDHDHACCPGSRSCGKCVRGILCGSCNALLGRLEARQIDPMDWVSGVTAYLDRYATASVGDQE